MKAQRINVHVAAAFSLVIAGSAGAAVPAADLDSQVQASAAVEFASSTAPVFYLASEAGHSGTTGAGATAQQGTTATPHSESHTTTEEAAVEGTVKPHKQHTDTATEHEGTATEHEGTAQQPAQ